MTRHAARIGRHPAIVVLIAILVFGGAPVFADERVDPVREYLDAQQRTRELFGQSDRLVDLWRDFAERHGDHEMGYVARLNQALWAMHRAASHDGGDPRDVDVIALLDWPEPGDEPPHASMLYAQAHRAALGLRARIEMLDLADRLQAYYRRHIEYPASLDVLVDAGLIAESQTRDPFGERYEYRARARAIMPDVPRQAYTLRSATLDVDAGGLRGLLDRLDEPFERLEVSSLLPAEGEAFVRERRDDGAWSSARRWTLGQPRAGATLWAVRDDHILIGWQQIPRVIRHTE